MMKAAAIRPGQLETYSEKKRRRPTGIVSLSRSLRNVRRVEVLVPGDDEGVDRGRNDAGRGQRHDDPDEGLELGCAVDAGGLFEFDRDIVVETL